MKIKICLYFWGVSGPWRGSVASYTTDERAKNDQKERWRWNLEELKLKIKSSSEKFRRLQYVNAALAARGTNKNQIHNYNLSTPNKWTYHILCNVFCWHSACCAPPSVSRLKWWLLRMEGRPCALFSGFSFRPKPSCRPRRRFRPTRVEAHIQARSNSS